MRDMTRRYHLARLGAIAAIGGALMLLVGTFLHPVDADPNDPAAAFAEYAADGAWVGSHLAQFLGVAGLGAALVALSGILDTGRASAWARIGAFGAAAAVATGAALQAVDGVALKVMVDRWAGSTPETRALAFEGAVAVRQIEIGFASLFSLVFALVILAFNVAILYSREISPWLGWVGLLGAVATFSGGVAQAYTGFSATAMIISMSGSAVLLLWAVALGIAMWRFAPGLSGANGTD